MGQLDLSWDDIEVFCLLAESNSFREAARRSTRSSETIRRRITTLEVALGVRLFRRNTNGLVITRCGAEVLKEAVKARRSISRIASIAGAEPRPRGHQLNVLLPEDLGSYWIIPFIDFENSVFEHTTIAIQSGPLKGRDYSPEFDITVQYSQPTENDIICKRIGYLHYGFCFHGRSIDMRSKPTTVSSLASRPLVLPTSDFGFMEHFKLNDADDRIFAATRYRIDGLSAMLHVMGASNAIGFAPGFINATHPRMQSLRLSDLPNFRREVWLGYHEDLRDLPSAMILIEMICKSVNRREIQCFFKNADDDLVRQAALVELGEAR